MIRHAAHVLWLAAVWVALWGELNAANALGGLLVGGVLVGAFPRHRSPLRWRLRPLPAVRFAAVFFRDFVEANFVVAWEVITPNNESVNEGIVAIPLTGASDGIVTIVANAISLTPGTLTLEVRRDPTVLYVHVMHLREIEDVRRDVLQLELLALRAFGSDDAIAEAERCAAQLGASGGSR